MAEFARTGAGEAERRRGEADLAATLARELLAGERTQDALRATARRLAEALGLASASLELGATEGNERHQALALRGPNGETLATLLVPRRLPAGTSARLHTQVVPTLSALVAVALHRADQRAAPMTDSHHCHADHAAAPRRSCSSVLHCLHHRGHTARRMTGA